MSTYEIDRAIRDAAYEKALELCEQFDGMFSHRWYVEANFLGNDDPALTGIFVAVYEDEFLETHNTSFLWHDSVGTLVDGAIAQTNIEGTRERLILRKTYRVGNSAQLQELLTSLL
jgi:hypothetical protein